MAPPDVNLRHFFALADIAKTGRVSSAAEIVCMSQSALTQALRKLEELAGTTLFERAGFGVTETPAGGLLIRRATRAIDLLAQADREIRGKLLNERQTLPLQRHVKASQLRALIAIVATGGYSFAARKLGLAQPSVHRAAKSLEDSLELELFPRGAKGVEPNDAARSLARYAELVFGEIRQGFEEVAELRGMTNSRIAIGCLPLARSEFLPAAVTQLLIKCPDARITILDGPYIEQLHALRYGQIDWLIGALRDPLPTNDVVQEPLFNQSLAVVVRPGHPLLSTGAPGVDTLGKLDWIAPRPLAPARKLFNGLLERNGVPTPSHVIECGSLIATRALVRQSDRAALLSPLQIREDIAAGQLALLIESIPDTERAIGLTTRRDWEPTMVQQQFTGVLRKTVKRLGL